MEARIKEPPKAGENPDEVRMSFGDHLEELRWRLIKCVVMLLVTFSVAMIFYKEYLYFITRPHFWTMGQIGIFGKDAELINISYTAPIWAVMKMGFIIGLFAASPWIGYQIWAFVSAGLYKHEKRWVQIFAPVSFLLFAGGSTFGYLVLVPVGLWGMATMMGVEGIVATKFALSDYLSLVMTLTIVTGAIFQLPLIMCFTTAIGLTTAGTWWRWTRLAVVVIFIAAAVLTPSPDIYTQLLMAAPLFLLYLVGMAMCLLIRPRKKQAA